MELLCIEDDGAAETVAHPHYLRHAREQTQNPDTERNIQSQRSEFGGQYMENYGVEGLVKDLCDGNVCNIINNY